MIDLSFNPSNPSQKMYNLNPRPSDTGPLRKMALLAMALACCGAANAKTLFVNGANLTPGNGTSWATSYKYLRDALAASAFNDEIWVAKGTYYPDDTDGLDKESIFLNREASFEIKGQKIYGGFAGTEVNLSERNAVSNPTILSGEIDPGYRLYSSFNITIVTANSTLDSLTIEKGLANGSESWVYPSIPIFDQGGACYVSKDKVLTLQNCTFSENSSVQHGGAIMVESGETSTVANVIAVNCTFDQNSIYVTSLGPKDCYGGAIYGNVTATNCKFTSNSISTDSVGTPSGRGGAISGNTTATNCQFIENTVEAFGPTPAANGGAIFGNANVVNCDFIGNELVADEPDPNSKTSTTSGGAIDGTVTGKNCTFSQNLSDSDVAYGGAIRGVINAANFVFSENEGGAGTIDFQISDNGVPSGGGRGNGGGGAVFVESGNSTLVNCVFVKNTSRIRGGAIAATGAVAVGSPNTSSLIVTNSTFLDNGVFAKWNKDKPAIFTTGSAISCMANVRILNNIFWNSTDTSGIYNLSNFISVTAGGLLRNTYENYPGRPEFARNVMKDNLEAFSVFTGYDLYLGEITDTFVFDDPLFQDDADPDGADDIWRTADDGLRLEAGSSAITTTDTITIRGKDVPYRNFLLKDTLDIDGDGDVNELIPSDIAGYVRKQNTLPLPPVQPILEAYLDIGAYEYGELLNVPDISVEQPAGTILADGTSTIDFGTDSGIPKTFVIKNIGGSDLKNLTITADGVDAGSFKFTQPVSTLVPTGSSTTFTVTFLPKLSGPLQAAIHIASNDPDSSLFDIGVVGLGILPDITVRDPLSTSLTSGSSTVGFGPVASTASASKTFTITNNGLGNLSIQKITSSGTNAANFTATAPGQTFLAPGASTMFSVTFKPLGLGNRAASIVIDNSDPDEAPFIIKVTGSGFGIPEILVNQPTSKEIVSGATNDYGSVKVSSSYSKTFVINNVGSDVLRNIGVSLSGSGAFSSTKLAVSTLNPGAQAKITVTFKPTAVGSKTAVLKIVSNDSNESVINVNLIGKGISKSSKKSVKSAFAFSAESAGFMTAPAVDQSGGVVTVTKAADGSKYLVLTVEKTAGWELSKHTVEVSPNLVTWFSGANHTTTLVDSPTILKVRDKIPYTQDGKRYIRLK